MRSMSSSEIATDEIYIGGLHPVSGQPFVMIACAAARRAIGTRNGEQLT